MPPDPVAPLELRQYIERVLDLYRRHPHTTGSVRGADRSLANDLYRQAIDIDTIEAALLLVAARRSRTGKPPTTPIRSLHYFLPTIRETQEQPLDVEYIQYLKHLTRQQLRSDHHLP